MSRKARHRRSGAPAVSAGGSSTSSLFKRALALQEQGKLAASAVAYRQALQADPNHLDARNNLGNVLRDSGDHESAMACYRQTIAINPGYHLAHYNLANSLRDRGQLEDAIAGYRRTLEAEPSYTDACNNLGVTLLELRQTDEATACFYRAIVLDPRHALAHMNLGRVLRDQGKHEEAAASYRRTIELAPRNVDARCYLGAALRELGKMDESLAAYAAARKIDPNYSFIHLGIAETLRAQGKLESAVTALRRGIQLHPNNAHFPNNLGNVLRLLDRVDEAHECYRRALAIDPDHPDARMNFAIEEPFSPDDPDFKRLKALLDRPDWTEDKRNQTVFALARGYDAAGDYDRAMSYFIRGNAEMSERTNFNRRKHWDLVAKIKAISPDAAMPESADPAPDRQMPVFVVGLSRSGKTLVESLLKQHPRVFAAGEREAFLDALDDIRKDAGIAVGFPSCIPRLEPAHLRALGERYMAIMSRLSDAEILINTLPGSHLYLGLILRALPTAKVVFCRREPIDQCLRIYFKRYAKENEHAYSFENIAAYHDRYLDMMAHWQRLYGPRILEVQYEDLVGDPRAVAARLFKHLDLDMDPATLRADFSTTEIGHWQNYKAYLGPLQAALAGLIV